MGGSCEEEVAKRREGEGIEEWLRNLGGPPFCL